jgi:hypothetical protein
MEWSIVVNNRRAVILFVRDEREEAAAKPLPGSLRADGYGALNARIIERLRAVERHGIDLVIVGASRTSGLQQHGASFGQRITNAITDTFALGYDQVVAVGNDCPTMTSDDLLSAFDRLDYGASIVAAPARDGGVYLIGAHVDRFQTRPFVELPWQTDRLFEELCRLDGAIALPTIREDFDSWFDRRARRALMRLLRESVLCPGILPSSFPFPSPARRKARSRCFLTAPPRS